MPSDRDESHFAFQQDCLLAHNDLRKEHGCPPLKWSSDLAEGAQSWADKLAERGRLLYAEMPGIGENIVFLTPNGLNNNDTDPSSDRSVSNNHLEHPSSIKGADIVKHWAVERDLYDFDKSGWQRKAHNFTQMIWKSSNELGIGRATTSDGRSIVVVAFYKPGGNSNKDGDFAKNVPKMSDI